jgi:predicted SAM-dependent methyltransferase
MTRLPVRTGAVDAVTALHSTIHLPIDDHPAAYREFARVLRPGGWLLVTVSETAWTGRNDDWLDAGVEMRWSYPDEADSRAALADAGFEVVDRRLDDGSLADETWPVLLARLAGR